MTQPETPSFYSIEKLLSQTVQPFPDLPVDEFEVLKQSIRDRGLLNPVLLTEDGYLFDGHQRLKAMVAIGRKRITAGDVKVQPGVTRANMLGYAYASNLVRRMLTTEQKVVRMHQCVKLGWSQRRIAKEFHMTQPAVSQLLAAHPDVDTPDVIVTQGADGKTYTRHAPKKRPRDERPEADSRYDRRQRIKQRLNAVRLSLTHVLADAEACGQFDGYEREGIREDIETLTGMLSRISDTITPKTTP